MGQGTSVETRAEPEAPGQLSQGWEMTGGPGGVSLSAGDLGADHSLRVAILGTVGCGAPTPDARSPPGPDNHSCP